MLLPTLTIVLIGILILFLLSGLFIWFSRREKRLYDTLNAMLDQAISGNFTETCYNESRLSALEMKMVRFLNSSSLSSHKLEHERNQIKALVSDISHQTKTPLSNISLYTELLMEMQLPKESLFPLQSLSEQVRKLSFLVNALVKISRLESQSITVLPKPNRTDLLLEEVYRQALPSAQSKGVSLTLYTEPQEAVFDHKWTQEAIYNIVDNGIKYTPSGGSVTIRTTAYQLFCRIDIEDTGIGIAEPEQAEIFTRFYRSQDTSTQEGIGVGLFLARKILNSEGGYLKVSSKKGEGSCFSVYLPFPLS